ncbi:MAG: DUF4062 domain-containing protein [Clostridium butyricum]
MKKLQVFISSTYIDLKEERQAAVEAILDSGNIPAGMELFKAGNETQLKTIERWIDESDVYLLILGGRYGSIEEKSGKSYTHLEYEYAVKKNIPIFAVVLSESKIFKKASIIGKSNSMEEKEIDKYKKFKELVYSKIVREVEDIKDIKLSIHTTLNEFMKLYKFSGWIKGKEIDDYNNLLKENNRLLNENQELKNNIDKITKKAEIGSYNYEVLRDTLRNKKIVFSKKLINKEKDLEINYIQFIKVYKNMLITGVTNQYGTSDLEAFIYYNVAPYLITFNLLEKNKVAGVKYERIQASKDGLKFFAKLELDDTLK